MGRDDLRRPPQWADALLRTCLKPEEAETESGDLLEAYRDSIHPLRGRWRADLWYVRQVAGYILRARGMNLRNGILAGLVLSVFAMLFNVFIPGLLHGPILFVVICDFSALVLLYGYAAVWHTRPVTPGDSVALRLGTRYGIAVSVLWIVGYAGMGLGVGMGVVLVLVALLLPLVGGAHGAIEVWSVRVGMRVGFWSGLVSGLIVFLSFMAIGTVEDEIRGSALYYLILCGSVFSVIGGTVGGFSGILLARTGRGPAESRRVLWGILMVCMGSAMYSGGCPLLS